MLNAPPLTGGRVFSELRQGGLGKRDILLYRPPQDGALRHIVWPTVRFRVSYSDAHEVDLGLRLLNPVAGLRPFARKLSGFKGSKQEAASMSPCEQYSMILFDEKYD